MESAPIGLKASRSFGRVGACLSSSSFSEEKRFGGMGGPTRAKTFQFFFPFHRFLIFYVPFFEKRGERERLAVESVPIGLKASRSFGPVGARLSLLLFSEEKDLGLICEDLSIFFPFTNS